MIACYSENWDGNPWYTGQVRKHVRLWKGKPPWIVDVPPEDRLE